MANEKYEYKPLMMHGWTHLPDHLWPDNIPVDLLPWVFRDVANYHPYKGDLHRCCVYIRPVHDEIFLTIEQLRVHWLKSPVRTESQLHPLQMVPCEQGGTGPLYIAAGLRDEFSIPSVIINVHDGRASLPECEDGPMRFTLAKRRNFPVVLTLVTEQHFERGEYQQHLAKEYFAPIDPKIVQVNFRPDQRLLDEELNNMCHGKRWDLILEGGYFQDGSSAVSYSLDMSRVPTFIRETDFLSEGNDTYGVETGLEYLEAAEDAGLSMILAHYKDILRLDNDALTYHNHLYDIRRKRENRELQIQHEIWRRSLNRQEEGE